MGAWFVGIGFAAFHGIREEDCFRILPLHGGYTAFRILELAASLDFRGT